MLRMVTEEVHTILHLQNLFKIWRTVLPLDSIDNLEKMHPQS